MCKIIDTTLHRQRTRRILVEGPVQGVHGDEPGVAMATEWSNGEGWDLSVGDKPPLGIHDSEMDLLKHVIAAIEADSYLLPEEEEKMYGSKKRH